MNLFVIAVVAWSGATSALDITPPANAVNETQSCDTTIDGVSYDPRGLVRGKAKSASSFQGERVTWKDGDVTVVATKGFRLGDRPGQVTTMMRTTVTPMASGEHESVQLTIESVSADGTTDRRTSTEENDYEVNGNVRTLVSRMVDGELVPPTSETITNAPTARGRSVITINGGPFVERTSDDGSYVVIQNRTRTCEMAPVPKV